MPSAAQAAPALPLLLIFVVFLIIPGTFGSLWGPKYLSPAVSGLLFMSEIAPTTLSAALLAGEAFGLREGIGVALIAIASLVEPLWQRRGQQAAG